MSVNLKKIDPILAPLVPPAGSIAAGFTPDGTKQIWKRIRRMNRPVPMMENGQQVWLRNANGDKVLPKRKAVIVEEEQFFTLEHGASNEVVIVEYKFPTPEEIAAGERARKVKALGGGPLAEALVDMGLTSPDQIKAALSGNIRTSAESEIKVGDETFSVPTAELEAMGVVEDEKPLGPLVHNGGPNFILGNGEKFRGKKEDAEAKQRELEEAYQARQDAKMTPSF